MELDDAAADIEKNYLCISPPHEAFYIQSIYYPAASCLECFDLYKDMISSGDNISPVDLFRIVQEAITHAAALSRFFWPSSLNKQSALGKLSIARGKKLRAAYKLDEQSVLSNRDLRNAWEHFDEKLDMYLLKNPTGIFFPAPLIDSHKLSDDEIGHIFKLIDPEESIIVLMGNKYNFLDIEREVRRVLSSTIEKGRNGSRL